MVDSPSQELSDTQIIALIEGELIERVNDYFKSHPKSTTRRQQLRRIIIHMAQRKPINHIWLSQQLQTLIELGNTTYKKVKFQPGRLIEPLIHLIKLDPVYQPVINMLYPRVKKLKD